MLIVHRGAQNKLYVKSGYSGLGGPTAYCRLLTLLYAAQRAISFPVVGRGLSQSLLVNNRGPEWTRRAS